MDPGKAAWRRQSGRLAEDADATQSSGDATFAAPPIWRRQSPPPGRSGDATFTAPTIWRRRSRKCRRKKRQRSDFLATAGDARSGRVLPAMQIEAREFRCTGCGSLLAKLVDGALSLLRSDLQATFDGDFHASIVCYRAKCRRLNVLRVHSPDRGGHDAGRSPPH